MMVTEIGPSDLKDLDPSEQKDLRMRWFLANYEAPAENPPYDLAGGGYIWIWSDPYDAREEIEGYFHEYAQESVIYASGSVGHVEGVEERG